MTSTTTDLIQTGRPTRLGMITPSSNACLEPMTYRILTGRHDVTVHSARIPVTAIALDEASDRQFDIRGMRAAAELLATADVDVIAWNGTSGSWVGVDRDRGICEEITNATGIASTTSTLAYFDAFERFGITRIGLVTPYTPDINTHVIANYATHGIEVTGHVALGLSDNESFARVSPEALLPGSLKLAAEHPDALIYLCTNLYGAPVTEQVEKETSVPVLDSVAVTLWKCLDMTGAKLLDTRWGRLLS